jgi:dihydroorotate dehydrogenase (NAD+) catalytic subunit
MDMSVDLAPARPGMLVLKNPVLAGGAAFGYGREMARLVDLPSLGGLVTRVTTLRPQGGGAPPRMAPAASGVVMAAAPNPGLRAALRDNARQWSQWDLPVILAVAGQSAADCATMAAQLEGVAGVAALALDLSVEPEPGRPPAGFDAAEAWLMVRALRDAWPLPLLVRLPYCVPGLAEVASAVVLAGADAVMVTASPPALNYDVRARRVCVRGGLAGPAVLPLILHCVDQAARALPGVPLVAGAGAATGEDAAACLLAGATAVEVDVAALADPRAPLTVLAELKLILAEWGRGSVAEMVGKCR